MFAVFASALRDGGGGSTPSARASAVEKWFPLCDTRSYVYGVRCAGCSCAGLNSRCTDRIIFRIAPPCAVPEPSLLLWP